MPTHFANHVGVQVDPNRLADQPSQLEPTQNGEYMEEAHVGENCLQTCYFNVIQYILSLLRFLTWILKLSLD